MEFISRLRWLIIGFFILIFLILVGWGLSTIARNIFTPSNAGDLRDEASVAVVEGTDTARLLVSGPVVAASEHRSYTIDVNSNVVLLTLYSNYGQKELDQKSYRNNQEAFNAFLKALETSNIADRIRGTTTEDDRNFEGECPTGRRYVVSLDSDFQRWSTSCRSAPGTIDPLIMSQVRRLFNAQAPDAQEILSGTNLFVN